MTNREIDVLIEKYIFGHEKIVCRHAEDDYHVLIESDGWDVLIPLRYFTESISDAWQVLEKLKNDGYGINLYGQDGFKWQVQLYEGRTYGAIVTFDELIEHTSAPMAICLAALKSVGVEIAT
ncbi:BC1872 family protein [Effusibacillus dendaii]|uniref:Phage ABA sandwich domain-containing protein n=1 Tax=Effusibacillus dendaii TaxID=2743772 RepID=A0A7I8D8P2_9BACL|nr:hypothetical protein [Effusibacillus dendaii]BCJ86494.1 hypothetical protein skT53_14790 [Effusibacillus dendaii]